MPTLLVVGTWEPTTHFDRLISIATQIGSLATDEAGVATSFSASMSNPPMSCAPAVSYGRASLVPIGSLLAGTSRTRRGAGREQLKDEKPGLVPLSWQFP